MEEYHISKSLTKLREVDQILSISTPKWGKEDIKVQILKSRNYLSYNGPLKYNINWYISSKKVTQLSKLSYNFYRNRRLDILEWLADRFIGRSEDYMISTGESAGITKLEFKKIEDAVEFKLTFVDD
jgi:hypothetical protein